jgi:octaprenyl-diphosphate synthase
MNNFNLTKQIEARIKDVLPGSGDVPREMTEDIERSRGKYLRAVLCVSSAEFAGSDGDKAIDLASSIELVHRASLLQDDVFDNETERRGEPAFHSKWGKSVSILYSDVSFIRAISILNDMGNKEITGIVLDTITDMCMGEIAHHSQNHEGLTEKEYLDIVSKKTAVLFKTACLTGAMLGTVDKTIVEKIGAFGHSYGMAYQLIDDCMDLNGTDQVNGTITLPRIYDETTCDKTFALALSYVNDAKHIIDSIADELGQDIPSEITRLLNWTRSLATCQKQAPIPLKAGEKL